MAVTVNGDTAIEPDETVLVNLSGPTNAVLGDAQGVATITNDDQPSLTINDVSLTEGNSGTKTATFTVTLAPTSAQTVTVAYRDRERHGDRRQRLRRRERDVDVCGRRERPDSGRDGQR